MGGEVTRKVTIELGVKLGDVQAIRAAATEAERMVKAADKAESGARKADKATQSWEQQLTATRKRITELGDAAALAGDQFNAELDEAISKEKLLIEQIEKRNAAITAARDRVAPGSGKPRVQPEQRLTLDDELAKVRKAQADVTEEMARTGKVGGVVLDQLTQKEKLLVEQIKRRDAALDAARAKQGLGPVGPAGPGLGKSVGEGLERINSSLGRVAIPVAIMTMAPTVANQFGQMFSGLSIDLFGTAEERSTGGFFTSEETTKGGKLFWEAMVRAGASDFMQKSMRFGGIDKGQTALLGFSLADLFASEKEAIDDRVREENRSTGLSQEAELRQRHVDLVRATQEKERKLLDEQLKLAEDKVKTAQAAVDQEKRLLEDARKAFGLLTADEQQALQSAGKKAAGGGVGTLNKEELDLVRNNPLFAGLFEKQAEANAKGFDELVKLLGADEKLRKAEAELKLSVEQKNEITVKLDALDKVVADLEAKLAPVLEQVTQRLISETQQALDKLSTEQAAFGQ